MRSSFRSFCLLLSLAFLASSAGAVERELLLLMDIPMVVTAAKMEQPINEAPATIEVVTEQEIERYGLRTLADVLRLVPGIDMASIINQMYFCPRGLNAKRANSSVLCLMDGHPYNEITRGTIDPFWVSLVNVKRIEIIKGPGSALYGANAFAGVINIITKDAADVKRPVVAAGAGTNLTQQTSFLTSVPGCDTVLSGWRYYTDSLEGRTVSGNNDDREDIKLTAKTRCGGLTVEGDYYQGETGVVINPDYRGKLRQSYAALDYDRVVSDAVSLKLLSHMVSVYQRIDYEGLGTLVADGTRGGLEGQMNWKPAAGHTVVCGAEWKNELNDSEVMQGKKTITTGAFYAQEEARPTDWLIVTLGGRYDIPSAFDNVFSPRANAVVKLSERTTLKFAYGEAFRAPNFFELYIDVITVSNGLNYHMKGNDQLKPERIKTSEFGLSRIFGRALQADVNLFHITTADAIAFLTTFGLDSSGNVVVNLDHRNSSAAEIKGGELSLRWKPSERVESVWTYSYQDAYDNTGAPLSIAPKNKASMRWQFGTGEHASLSFLSTYVSDTIDTWGLSVNKPIDAHVSTDATFIYRVGPQLSFSAVGKNIFNDRYFELPRFPLGGSKYLLEGRYTF